MPATPTPTLTPTPTPTPSPARAPSSAPTARPGARTSCRPLADARARAARGGAEIGRLQGEDAAECGCTCSARGAPPEFLPGGATTSLRTRRGCAMESDYPQLLDGLCVSLREPPRSTCHGRSPGHAPGGTARRVEAARARAAWREALAPAAALPGSHRASLPSAPTGRRRLSEGADVVRCRGRPLAPGTRTDAAEDLVGHGSLDGALTPDRQDLCR